MLMVEIFLSTGAMKCLRATPSCSSKDKDISDYQLNRITALFAVTEKRVRADPGCYFKTSGTSSPSRRAEIA